MSSALASFPWSSRLKKTSGILSLLGDVVFEKLFKFFITLLYIQTTFTSDNTSGFVLNMTPILALQSTVNTLVANRLDVCSDVVYDLGKCKRSNVSHVCAGRLRIMLVARLGNVKKGDIGTHTHTHSPHSLSAPSPSTHQSVSQPPVTGGFVLLTQGAPDY